MSGAWALLLAASPLNGEIPAGHEPAAYLWIEPSGQAATNAVSQITQYNPDTELAGRLVGVFHRISQSQKELDADAKRILYARMRELYRR